MLALWQNESNKIDKLKDLKTIIPCSTALHYDAPTIVLVFMLLNWLAFIIFQMLIQML